MLQTTTAALFIVLFVLSNGKPSWLSILYNGKNDTSRANSVPLRLVAICGKKQSAAL